MLTPRGANFSLALLQGRMTRTMREQFPLPIVPAMRTRGYRIRRIAAALTLTLSLLASAPAVGEAGTYVQFACKRPDGSLAPGDRWSGGTSATGGFFLVCGGPA